MIVLLINPRFSVDGRYADNHFTEWLPIGLLHLAAALGSAGHIVHVRDMACTEGDIEDLVLRWLQEVTPELVGITGTSPQHVSQSSIASAVRERTHAPIVCGGPHATAEWQAVLKNPAVDYVILGEGDVSLNNLIAFLQTGAPFPRGVAHRNREGVPVFTGPQEPYVDIEDLPTPAYDLVDMAPYLDYVEEKEGFRAIAYLASRGCPFQCTFCAVHCVLGRKLRLKSPAKTIDEVSALMSSTGATGVFFKDSTFTANKQWVYAFCKETANRSLHFPWKCNTRVDCVDEPLLSTMKKTGMVGIWFGIESGSQRTLDRLHKNFQIRHIENAINVCRALAINVGAWMIVGNPGESMEDIQASVRLVKQLGLRTVHWHACVPLPGSALFEEYVSEGHPVPDYSTLRFNKATIDTGPLTATQVQILFEQILRQARTQQYDETRIGFFAILESDAEPSPHPQPDTRQSNEIGRHF